MYRFTVTAIIARWAGLFGEKAWRPQCVNVRTPQRWLREGTGPSGVLAKAVAQEVWDLIADSPRLKKPAFSVVREVVPDAPCKSWTRETMGAWFFEVAERELQQSKYAELSATLDLSVWRPGIRGLSVRQQEVRPLRSSDEVRVQVTVPAPLHLYLVWISLEQGRRRHAPFFPWPGRWDAHDPAKDIPRTSLMLPDLEQTAWRLDQPCSCLETLVLLARRQSLPDRLRQDLPSAFDSIVRDLPPVTGHLDAGLLDTFTSLPRPAALESAVPHRLPTFASPVEISDPLHQLNCALRDRLSGPFDLVQTLSVAYVAGSDATPHVLS